LGSFKKKIDSRTDEAGKCRDADDYAGIGGKSTTKKILLEYKKTDEYSDGYEKSVGGQSDWPDVNERKHLGGSLLYTVLRISLGGARTDATVAEALFS
jgi:hypothetical protein